LNDIDVPLPSHGNVTVMTVPFNQLFWNAQFPMEKLVKKFLFTVKSYWLVKRTLRKKGIDLLYLYNIPQCVYLLGRRPKVVFDFADDILGMLEAELSITGSHPLSRLASAVLNWMVNRSDVIICISGPLFEKVKHQNKYLIPNGASIPPNGVVQPPTRTDSGGRITVGYVGTFEYTRALANAIELAKRMPDVDFLLVGSGRDFSRIQRDVERFGLTNVRLTGAVSHEEAMKYISTMDICLNLFNKISVSHSISPLKLFEYLSHKKPVISTRLKEVERIDRGFLYFADTVDEIVERVRYIILHWQEACERAEKGYETVSKEFAWPTIARDFLTAVESMKDRSQ
jgi:glycosyltransferase involved in cell wall biosynthesis